jgi:glycosyltransferase involved in cell wall biosynthesis
MSCTVEVMPLVTVAGIEQTPANSAMRRPSLRILAIVPNCFCFGLQDLTLSFFAELPPRICSHFLGSRWTDGEFDRRLDALGIPHSATWLGMFSRNLDSRNLRMTLECLRKLPIAWRDLLQQWHSFRPDVIYLANYHEVILLSPVLFWLRRGVVCHMHDPPPPIGFQRFSFFIWRRAIGRFLFVSENVRQRMAKLGRLKPGDAVIHNGVRIGQLDWPRRRTNRFREQFNWPDEVVIFGITGQINADKGHREFLLAAAQAVRENARFRFVVGGRGEENFVAELKRQADVLGLTDLLGFCGWLTHASEFYGGIDVLVLASRHDEGFGLVVAEAGERGIPVIATRSGGAVEIVVDGETGILIPKQDPSALGSAMAQLGNDGDLRIAMGGLARDHISRHFDLEKQVDKFTDFLALARA